MNTERLLEVYEQISEAPEAIARLRRFVLDLAVRGKLVGQDPADEPASLLLRRLHDGKERLIERKVIKKPRELGSEGELTRPHNIPRSWNWCRLDRVGAIVGGGTPSASDASNFDKPGSGIPWLTPADLGGYTGLYISHGARDLTDKGLNSSSATLMPTGSILFTSRAPIGYVAIADNPIATNQGFKSVVPYVSDCSRFIALTLKALAPEIDSRASGTTFKEVSGKIVAGISFPLPPLPEQHRIVAKVDELMALCDRLEEARKTREETRDRLTAASLARLTAADTTEEDFPAHAAFVLEALPALTARPDQIKTLRQTILNLAVRGKLVDQDSADEPASAALKAIAAARDADTTRKSKRARGLPTNSDVAAFDLPTGWESACLSDVAISMRYGTSTKCGADTSLVPVLRIPNVSSGRVTLEDMKFGPLSDKEHADLALAAGDLLMIRSNGSLDIVGRSAVVTAEASGMAFAGYLVRLRTAIKHLNTSYVWLAMNSQLVRDQIEKPIRSAVGLKNVNLTEFGNLSFWLPPLAEQHRIVEKVNALMGLCDQLEAALTTTDTTRTRLLEALIHETLEPAIEVSEAAE